MTFTDAKERKGIDFLWQTKGNEVFPLDIDANTGVVFLCPEYDEYNEMLILKIPVSIIWCEDFFIHPLCNSLSCCHHITKEMTPNN